MALWEGNKLPGSQCQFAATVSKNCPDWAPASPQLCALLVLSGPRPLSWSLTPAMSWALMGLEVARSQAEMGEFAVFVAQGDCTWLECVQWGQKDLLTLSSVIVKKLICVVLFFFLKRFGPRWHKCWMHRGNRLEDNEFLLGARINIVYKLQPLS